MLLLVAGSSTMLGAAEYFATKALAGDGVYSLLRRYDLDDYSCNFTKFYELNGLRKNARLIVGKSYQLPLERHVYNGKSIRSTLGIDSWETAVMIRDYNYALSDRGQLEGRYEDTKLLLVPYHILHCPDDKQQVPDPVSDSPEEVVVEGGVSAGSGQRIFPIFGPKYAYTPLASTKLRGKVFYIVGGHGGPDPGAIGQRAGHRLCEDEYAYDVALRLCRNLIAHGATAYMINRDPNDGIRGDLYLDCDQDEVIWGNIKQSPSQKVRLTQRSEVINTLYEKHRLQGVKEQTVVVIHVDSRSHSQQLDLFFYHHPSS
ncbi:MAG: N-acetylmuramoyl-L-alanine amidase, partial [Bacteroidetes bacterium]